MVQDFNKIDAFLFWDFPQLDNCLVNSAFTSKKPCYLVVAECLIIRPDNLVEQNQNYFFKIFTYLDNIIDNKKYFKLNHASDFPSTINKELKKEKK